jgi:hypothetical protein
MREAPSSATTAKLAVNAMASTEFFLSLGGLFLPGRGRDVNTALNGVYPGRKALVSMTILGVTEHWLVRDKHLSH